MSSGGVVWTELEEIRQSLWYPLLSWYGVYKWWYDHPLSFMNLSCACKDFRHMSCDVWLKGVHQPYLAHIPQRLGVLRTEVRMRRFLARLQQDLALILGLYDVGIVGEYAAWSLERVVETNQGRDSYPHTTRSSTIWDGRTRLSAWFPERFDVVVECGDREMEAVTCVVDAYNATFSMAASRIVQVEDDIDVHDHPVMPLLLRQFNHDDDTIRRCTSERVHATPDDRGANRDDGGGTKSHVKKTTYMIDGIVPIRLSLFSGTRVDSRFVDYATRWLDFEHLRISMTVDASQGQWRFRVASETAALSLLQRRLTLTPKGVTTVQGVHELDCYMARGFRFDMDDQYWPDEEEALLALYDAINQ